jgi:hypothetical protein
MTSPFEYLHGERKVHFYWWRGLANKYKNAASLSWWSVLRAVALQILFETDAYLPDFYFHAPAQP